MTTIAEIEIRARKYSEAREAVKAIVAALNEAIDAIKRSELPKLRRAVRLATEHHDNLKALAESAHELFVKPKTLTFHGVRVGYMKGKGGIVFDDADAVVAAIQKQLPDQAEALIRWIGKPLKEALNQLDVATLKKIGCRVEDTGDVLVIKPVDSAVDKMVDALLRDATEEVVS